MASLLYRWIFVEQHCPHLHRRGRVFGEVVKRDKTYYKSKEACVKAALAYQEANIQDVKDCCGAPVLVIETCKDKVAIKL